jgi:RHS repeat-associated protein
MKWNFKEELQAVAKQSVVAGTPETTWYVYDGRGQRARKITENQAADGVVPTKKSQRIYVGGIEVYREYGVADAITLERESYHVMDDKSRVAMIETRTQGMDDAPGRLVRYQFSNHLGSACIETDDTARVISYEEYHPFGTTSYQAVDKDIKAAAKRYRYTSLERDEESGLSYHSARYYLPWLGRWLSADPSGIEDGVNVYVYARNRVIVGSDTDGKLFWFVVAAIVIGAAVGAGIETVRQLRKPPEQRDWTRVATAAAGGAVAGLAAGLTGGQSLGWQLAGVAVGSALGGTTTRTLNRESTTAGDVAWDVGIGLVTFGLLRGAGAAWGRFRPGAPEIPGGGGSRGGSGRPGGGRGAAAEGGTRPGLPGQARAPRPPIPERYGTNTNKFGSDLGWGNQMSPEASREAARRLGLEHFRRLGITPERAQQWLAFYRDVVRLTPNNPSAAGRLAFFEEVSRMFARETATGAAAAGAGSASHGPEESESAASSTTSGTSSTAVLTRPGTPSTVPGPTVSSPLVDTLRSGSWLPPTTGSGSMPVCPPGVDACIRSTVDMPSLSPPPAYNPGTNSTTIFRVDF